MFEEIINYKILTLLLLTISFWYLLIFFLKRKLDTENFKRARNVISSIMVWGLFVFVFKDHIFSDTKDNEWILLTKISYIFFVFVVTYTSYNIMSYLLTFSKERRLPSTRRAWQILVKIAFFIGGLIASLNVLGVSDKIGIAGIIGSIGVFLGLTSGVWFPPIKSGLVMLFSKTLNEEDIIEVPELNIYGVVNSIGIFSTVIRNEIDNHRIVLPNNKLESSVINNLSKLARVGGLREKLEFKIGYINSLNKETKISDVKDFFRKAFEKSKHYQIPININFKKEIEIYLDNPGDHALEFVVFYYTDNIKTRIIDKKLLYEVFYSTSIEEKISLSTPLTIST